jgi:hypothetical protein
MKGFVRTPRGSLDDPLLRPRGPYTRFEANWWLREQAAIGVRSVPVGHGSRTTELKRGQLSYSFRFLGQKWGWDTAKVWRFLNGLRNSGRISYETDSETGQTLITICDYDSFGDAPRSGETARETPAETPDETNKKKEDNPSGSKEPSGQSAPEKTLFDQGKAVLGKSAGGLIATLLKHERGDPERALRVLHAAAQKSNPREYIGAVLRSNGWDAGDVIADTERLYRDLGVS